MPLPPECSTDDLTVSRRGLLSETEGIYVFLQSKVIFIISDILNTQVFLANALCTMEYYADKLPFIDVI